MSGMTHNETKIQECGHTGQILDFVYDELPVGVKGAFEHHLAACDACSGEVSSLASTSMAVKEWRAEAFEPLLKPRFSIQTGRRPKIGVFSTILGMFRQPVYAVAAATLLLGSAIGLYFLLGSSSSQPQVARSVDMPAVPAAVTPTVSVIEQEPAEEAKPMIAKDERPAENVAPTRAERPEGARQARLVRKSSDSAHDRAVATNALPQKAVPEDLFGEVPETRDRSLRLTDLFAEGDED